MGRASLFPRFRPDKRSPIRSRSLIGLFCRPNASPEVRRFVFRYGSIKEEALISFLLTSLLSLLSLKVFVLSPSLSSFSLGRFLLSHHLRVRRLSLNFLIDLQRLRRLDLVYGFLQRDRCSIWLMSSPIQIDSSGENSPNQNLVSSSYASLSYSLSLMEEETIARVHKARISKEGDAESSSVEGPRPSHWPFEVETSKAPKVVGSFPPGARYSRGRSQRGSLWTGVQEDPNSFGLSISTPDRRDPPGPGLGHHRKLVRFDDQKTTSSLESLEAMRSARNLSKIVEFLVPGESDRS
ncbi:unnamed protein product [Arabis nemorensis]|uniref:Uncharacterized protein n=1 Tax=Arabis nemorensis TaxID=586526 RepID=A0A565CN08_9BRAS|nr:unnamed protein product [Arabis nemorensis]